VIKNIEGNAFRSVPVYSIYFGLFEFIISQFYHSHFLIATPMLWC